MEDDTAEDWTMEDTEWNSRVELNESSMLGIESSSASSSACPSEGATNTSMKTSVDTSIAETSMKTASDTSITDTSMKNTADTSIADTSSSSISLNNTAITDDTSIENMSTSSSIVDNKASVAEEASIENMSGCSHLDVEDSKAAADGGCRCSTPHEEVVLEAAEEPPREEQGVHGEDRKEESHVTEDEGGGTTGDQVLQDFSKGDVILEELSKETIEPMMDKDLCEELNMLHEGSALNSPDEDVTDFGMNCLKPRNLSVELEDKAHGEEDTGVSSQQVCDRKRGYQDALGKLMDKGNIGEKKEEEEELSGQLNQLQNLVGEMKEGFVVAMEALARIQYGDELLTQKVDHNKEEYQQQLADVLSMVLSLKGEFGCVMGQLQVATEAQRGLQAQIEHLQYERDILLEELEKAGAISQQIRQQYHSGRHRPSSLNRSSSHTTLAVLLERARNTFSAHTPPAATSTHHLSSSSSGLVPSASPSHSNNSQAHTEDSGHVTTTCSSEDVTPPLSMMSPSVSLHHHHLHAAATVSNTAATGAMSPIVQSYIAGLQQHSVNADCSLLCPPPPPSSSSPVTEEHQAGGGYDSDSSLTAAANKSLDLSRSLGNCCAAAAGEEEEEDEEAEIEEGLIANGGGVKQAENKENLDRHSQHGSSPTKIMAQPPYDHSSPFKAPGTPRTVPLHERNARETQRSRVAREIVETERKYCSTLWTVLDHFALALRDCGYLNHKDVCAMFPSSLSRIYELHCDFLQRLEDRLLHWKYQGVLGDVFAWFIDSPDCKLLSHYQLYVNEFPVSLQLIKKVCRGSVKVRRLIKVLQRHPVCEALDLSSFLLSPIQRVPRYVLLLKQLLKYTAPDHPDYYHVETSLHKLGHFLTQLNDSIEYSMQLVTNAEPDSPKPKRKLRIPSFRQQSNQSSADQADSALSHPSLSSSRSSNGPFASFLREKRSTPSHGTQSASQLPHTPRKLPCPPPSLAEEASTPPAPTAYTASTLPLRGKKQRRPPHLAQRPKSGGYYTQENGLDAGSGKMDPLFDNNNTGIEEDNVSGVKLQNRRLFQHRDLQRPHSMTMVSREASFRSERSAYSAASPIPRPDSVMSGDDHGSLSNHHHPPPPLAASFSKAQLRSRSAPSSHKRHHHRSLPRIPTYDYGIYGDEDEEEGGGGGETGVTQEDIEGELREEMEEHRYRQNMENRRRRKPQRTLSQGDMLTSDDPKHCSPSQRRINAMLARSLQQKQQQQQQQQQQKKEQLEVEESESRPSSSLSSRRPKSSKDPRRHVTLPADILSDKQQEQPKVRKAWEEKEPAPPDTASPNDTLLNDTMDISVLNMTEPTTGAGQLKVVKRRKKDRRNRLAESMIEGDAGKEKWKIANFKASLKNMFFRKRKPVTSLGSVNSGSHSSICSSPDTIDRGSKVLSGEGDPLFLPTTPGSSKSLSMTQLPTSSAHTEAHTSLRTVPQQQGDIMTTQPAAKEINGDIMDGSFVDENGEPCSAV